jgi:hypothetical protein
MPVDHLNSDALIYWLFKNPAKILGDPIERIGTTHLKYQNQVTAVMMLILNEY